MNLKTLQFPNIGVITAVFTDEEIAPLKEEILEIQNNFNLAKKHNQKLVGNIKKEFELIKSKEHIKKIFEPYVWEFDNSFGYLSSQSMLTSDCLLTLDSAWVNFQAKHEFNPSHNHSGILSFVIWIEIPYKMEDENIHSPGAESSNPLAGKFTFHYTNSLGKICHQDIDADTSMENHFFLFPAELNHSVAPFYTSDKYRISVSGNYKFQIPEKNKDE
jgi:hypothetical protein